MIEGILKTGLQIIFQSEYVSFKNTLQKAQIKSLSQRRRDIMSKFSKQAEKSKMFCDWFVKAQKQTNTRSLKPIYKPIQCRTNRYERTALPEITRVISWQPMKQPVLK